MTKNEALFDLSKAFSTLHYTSSCTPQNEPYRVWYMLTHKNGTCVIEQSCAGLQDLVSEQDRFLGSVDRRSYKSGVFFMSI